MIWTAMETDASMVFVFCRVWMADCLFDQICRDGGCVADNGGPVQGDACLMTDAIRPGDRVQGSTANAASNYAATCGGSADGPEAVYEYRAAANNVCATTLGSSFDDPFEAICDGGMEIV